MDGHHSRRCTRKPDEDTVALVIFTVRFVIRLNNVLISIGNILLYHTIQVPVWVKIAFAAILVNGRSFGTPHLARGQCLTW